jgi:hypothetical protein
MQDIDKVLAEIDTKAIAAADAGDARTVITWAKARVTIEELQAHVKAMELNNDALVVAGDRQVEHLRRNSGEIDGLRDTLADTESRRAAAMTLLRQAEADLNEVQDVIALVRSAVAE